MNLRNTKDVITQKEQSEQRANWYKAPGVIFHLQCVTCRKLRRRTEHELMSDLPEDRLTPSPPFSNVGVDTFGPWQIVTRRTRGGQALGKQWAIMFLALRHVPYT